MKQTGGVTIGLSLATLPGFSDNFAQTSTSGSANTDLDVIDVTWDEVEFFEVPDPSSQNGYIIKTKARIKNLRFKVKNNSNATASGSVDVSIIDTQSEAGNPNFPPPAVRYPATQKWSGTLAAGATTAEIIAISQIEVTVTNDQTPGDATHAADIAILGGTPEGVIAAKFTLHQSGRNDEVTEATIGQTTQWDQATQFCGNYGPPNSP